MSLSFPNPSRSFDAAQRRVRFWGYDRTIEVSFFVELDALLRIIPDMSGAESDILRVFDAARDRIHAVAENLYARRPRGSNTVILAAQDF